MHNEREGFEELVAATRMQGGRDDGDVFETEAVEAAVNGALDVGHGVELWTCARRCRVCICVDSVQSADQCVDTRCVACKLGEVFDAVHHAASCIGEGEHEPLVGDEVFHTVTLAALLLDTRSSGQLGSRVETAPCRQKDGQRGDEIAKGGPGVFQHEVFKHVVADLEAVDAFHPVLEIFEASVEKVLFHLVAAIEGDFFRVGNQARVQSTEVAFSSAFHGFQFAKRWR